MNENEGLINIALLLDRPSCRPITMIASPQERSIPSATGDMGMYNVLCLWQIVHCYSYMCMTLMYKSCDTIYSGGRL